jgi:hypothetical protein
VKGFIKNEKAFGMQVTLENFTKPRHKTFDGGKPDWWL